MRVRATRAGGFAGGVEELGTLDTSSLGATAAGEVKNRITELERLEARTRGQPIGADLFRYDIEIQDDEGRHRVLTFTHEGDPAVPLPEPLAQLLRALEGRR